MRRHGPDGQVWVVDDIDPSALASLPPRPPPEDDVPTDDPNGPVEFVEESWTLEDCPSGNAIIPTLVYDDEDRVPASTIVGPATASAWIFFDGPGTSDKTCGAIFLDQSFILSAAHCFYKPDGSGDLKGDVSDFTVSSANGQQEEVQYVWNTGYDGQGDYKDDWVIARTQWPFLAHVTTMDLYDGPASTYDNIGANVQSVGYPGAILDSALQCVTTGGVYPYIQQNLLHTGTSDAIKFKGDSAKGQSGSPYFFCPGGASDATCEPGEARVIIGVHAGHYPTNGTYRLAGPHVSQFADEAALIVP